MGKYYTQETRQDIYYGGVEIAQLGQQVHPDRDAPD